MLKTGDLLPHFNVTTLGGEPFAYSDVWQRKNLLLVSLSHADSPGNAEYRVSAHQPDVSLDRG